VPRLVHIRLTNAAPQIDTDSKISPVKKQKDK